MLDKRLIFCISFLSFFSVSVSTSPTEIRMEVLQLFNLFSEDFNRKLCPDQIFTDCINPNEPKLLLQRSLTSFISQSELRLSFVKKGLR